MLSLNVNSCLFLAQKGKLIDVCFWVSKVRDPEDPQTVDDMWVNFANEYNLEQLVSEPTRGKNILDVLLCTPDSGVYDVEVKPVTGFDHDAVLTTFDMTKEPEKPPKPRPIESDDGWEKFKHDHELNISILQIVDEIMKNVVDIAHGE